MLAQTRAHKMGSKVSASMLLLGLLFVMASVSEARLISNTRNQQQIDSGEAQFLETKFPSEFAEDSLNSRDGLVLDGNEDVSTPIGEGFVLPTEEIYQAPKEGGLQEVNFSQCPRDLPAPTSLKVECSDRVRKTCALTRGGNYTVIVRFTAASNSTASVRSIVSWNTPFPRPLPTQDGAACGHMPCPLTAGTETTFHYSLHIPSDVMRRRYPLAWRLDDLGSGRVLLCFTFGIHLI